MKTMIAVLLLVSAARAQSAPASWQRLEGQHSGVKTLKAVAIQDSETWDRVWREHAAAAPEPAVDFVRESVVAVFLGETRAAGTKVVVVVQQDPLDAARLNVFYRQVSAAKPFAADVVCEPFLIVKVRRASVIDVEADARVTTPERRAAPERRVDTSRVRALQAAGALSFDGR